MTDVTGTNELTITATGEEIYKINYRSSTAVDIFNNTDEDVFVNSTGTFTKTDNVGNYLTVPAGGSYNGFRPDISAGTTVYIQANAAGNICVVRKGY